MPDTITCNHSFAFEETRGKTPGQTAANPLSLCITPEEADALLHVLLHVAPSALANGEMVERLLLKVADLRRDSSRSDAIKSGY